MDCRLLFQPMKTQIDTKYPYALTKFLEKLVIIMHQSLNAKYIFGIFNAYGLRSRTTGAYGAVFGVFLLKKYRINL